MTVVLKAQYKNDQDISAINRALASTYHTNEDIVFNTWAYLQEQAAYLNCDPDGLRELPHFKRPITKEQLDDSFFWFKVGEYSCKISCADSQEAKNAIAVCKWLADTRYKYIDQRQSENYSKKILHQYLDPVLREEGIDPGKIWKARNPSE